MQFSFLCCGGGQWGSGVRGVAVLARLAVVAVGRCTLFSLSCVSHIDRAIETHSESVGHAGVCANGILVFEFFYWGNRFSHVFPLRPSIPACLLFIYLYMHAEFSGHSDTHFGILIYAGWAVAPMLARTMHLIHVSGLK